MLNEINTKYRQGNVVILTLILVVLLAVGTLWYLYVQEMGKEDSIAGPTPIPSYMPVDVLPTPVNSESWEEAFIEPRNQYTFRFPSEFRIWDYDPAITYIETDDFIRISIEERGDGEDIPFAEFTINSSNDWLQTQTDEQSVLVEEVNLINQNVSIMGYYDPGREVATTVGPRYVLLAHLNYGEYPIRVTMAAHCRETGYHPTSPFRLISLEECSIREYSELRQILLDILSTIQPV